MNPSLRTNGPASGATSNGGRETSRITSAEEERGSPHSESLGIETRRRVNHPDDAFLLSAATRREGRYRCGQLKPFRLLLTEAAIACPHQVGQTTWTRQLTTSSFSVRLWAKRRRALRPAVRFPSPSLEAESGPGQCSANANIWVGTGEIKVGARWVTHGPPDRANQRLLQEWLPDMVGLRPFGTTTGTATR